MRTSSGENISSGRREPAGVGGKGRGAADWEGVPQ